MGGSGLVLPSCWQAICQYGLFGMCVARLVASHMLIQVVQALCCQVVGKPYANMGGMGYVSRLVACHMMFTTFFCGDFCFNQFGVGLMTSLFGPLE